MPGPKPPQPPPQPPRHRASAGDGAAKAVKPTVAAVANANIVFFMCETSPVFPEPSRGNFQRTTQAKVSARAVHNGRDQVRFDGSVRSGSGGRTEVRLSRGRADPYRLAPGRMICDQMIAG